MAQISCPTCDASYTVPDSAIGTKGRRVSCAKCGFEWHAMLPEPEPLVLDELIEAPDPAPKPSAPTPAPEAAAPPPPPPPPQPAAAQPQEQLREDRARQLAEIRQIVDEVQQDPSQPQMDQVLPSAPPGSGIPFPEATTTPAAEAPSKEPRSFMKSLADRMNSKSKQEPKAAAPQPMPAAPPQPAPAPPPPAPRPAPAPSQFESDDLRERIAQRGVDQKVGATKVTERSRRKMLKKHTRKAAKKAASDKRGTGAFATGFLLVLIVGSVLSSLYLLAPQISAQVPEAEPILNNYIAKVDEARAGAYGLVEDFMTKVEPVISEGEEG
ncbi:MAG: zinc-ribbon domain-containing protein [Pseudomonadota bacterium]